jgi:hypothetical protein
MSDGKAEEQKRASDGDLEKAPSELASATPSSVSHEDGFMHKLQENLLKWGVETRGKRNSSFLFCPSLRGFVPFS